RLVMSIAVVVAALVVVAGPAAAKSHHHRRRHHHHRPPTTTTTTSPGSTTTTTTPPPAGTACTASPNPVTLVTPGIFSASVQCNGLGNVQPVVFSSPSLALACTSVSLGGSGTSSASRTSDQLGRATVTVQGSGCSPRAVSILVTEATFTLTVP